MKRFNYATLLLTSLVSLSGCQNKFTFPTPTNLRIENHNLYWDMETLGSVRLPEYQITIGGELDLTKTVTSTQLNLRDIILDNGFYSFIVVAKPRISSFAENPSKELSGSFEIEVADVPTNILYQVEKGSVTWYETEGQGYKINVNNIVYETTSNIYPINSSVGTHNIQVSTLGDGTSLFDSPYSEKYVFKFLEKPKNLRLEGQTIYWNEVENANGYAIFNNLQQIATVSSSQISYRLSSAVTEWSITVKALGNGVTTFDSAMTSPLIFTTV